MNFIVWVFFVLETSVLTLLVDNKRRYLRENWLNLVIIIGGIPLLLVDHGPIVAILGALRVVLAIGLFTSWINYCIRFLTDNRLDTTIAAATLILILAGIIITGIDPAINNVGDGIWWAWVTVTTVGYGDVVPQSSIGRIFAAFLILMGLGLFSVITANFSAILLQKTMDEAVDEVKEEHDEIREISKRTQASQK